MRIEMLTLQIVLVLGLAQYLLCRLDLVLDHVPRSLHLTESDA